jgi:hypothetical protein
MEWLGKQLNFTTLEDWYKIKKSDFVDNCGQGLLNTYCILKHYLDLFLTTVQLFFENAKIDILQVQLSHKYFPITRGFHGSFLTLHLSFGKIQKINVNLWSGLVYSLALRNGMTGTRYDNKISTIYNSFHNFHHKE